MQERTVARTEDLRYDDSLSLEAVLHLHACKRNTAASVQLVSLAHPPAMSGSCPGHLPPKQPNECSKGLSPSFV